MMQYGLTPRQTQVFKFIKSYISKKGYSPSYEEIAKANNMKTKSHVSQIIVKLEQRQWITRIPNTSRSINILK